MVGPPRRDRQPSRSGFGSKRCWVQEDEIRRTKGRARADQGDVSWASFGDSGRKEEGDATKISTFLALVFLTTECSPTCCPLTSPRSNLAVDRRLKPWLQACVLFHVLFSVPSLGSFGAP